MHGATFAFRRSVFEAFPPLNEHRFFGATDQIFPIRAELLGGCFFLAEPLLQIRRHSKNLSRRLNHSGFPGPQRREFKLAGKIGITVALREDIQKFAEANPDCEKTRELGLLLDDHLFETLDQWIAQRNKLMLSKRHPVWVHLKDLESVQELIQPRQSDVAETTSWAASPWRILVQSAQRFVEELHNLMSRHRP